MTRTLWLVKETDKARQYSKIPHSRHPEPSDFVWIPRSLIEHHSKFPADPWPECEVTVADWFADKEGL